MPSPVSLEERSRDRLYIHREEGNGRTEAGILHPKFVDRGRDCSNTACKPGKVHSHQRLRAKGWTLPESPRTKHGPLTT